MLRDTQHVMGCAIAATDGVVGEVEDFYFDDQEWTLRYLVVATGAWLKRRKVLISPHSLGRPQWQRQLLPASITIEQVKSSPDIDTNKPVSRQHESLFLSHYQYPHYWEGAGPLSVGPNPNGQSLDAQFGWSDAHFSRAVAARDTASVSDAGEHLRSRNAIQGYSVRARDADIGQIHGLLFEEDDWAIRYLVIQTGHIGCRSSRIISPYSFMLIDQHQLIRINKIIFTGLQGIY